jgi:hypothetical protein
MKRLTMLALALVTGMTAAGCGDDDNGNPAGPSNTGPIVFTAALSALNEFPALAPNNAEIGARGNATITFRVGRDATGAVNGGGTVDWSVQLNSFPAGSVATAAHIHPGAAGTAGGVFLGVAGLSAATPVVMSNGTATLTFTATAVTQDQATQIVANPAGFYFNVHTPVNPGGAVRGQLVRQ